MDSVQSIFTQMRKSREAAATLLESEETKLPEEDGKLDESEAEKEPEVEQEPVETKVDEAEEDKVEEPADTIDEAEEFVVIKCHDCGAILSGLDEAEEGCPVCGSDDLDEKTVKVVKDGKVVTKKVSTKKRRLTAAQKAALAKARKKAHTASAAKARAKSNKVRQSKGMNEEDTITCPECGFEGQYADFNEENGALICPDCGAEVEAANNSKED